MTLRTAPAPTTGRLRTVWATAHAPVAGVPRWARIAAYIIPFTVLPSGLWRIAMVVYVCYAPLLLWGPLLAVVPVAYGQRRRRAAPTPGISR
ncbi:hypothetical protein [Streptomyces sp. NPDC005336]|uniref:hypothetical protein n=1 Tax=Streptomyces sp. NPDC005336 TaxID=3157035 RepID=UPI0033A22457